MLKGRVKCSTLSCYFGNWFIPSRDKKQGHTGQCYRTLKSQIFPGVDRCSFEI